MAHGKTVDISQERLSVADVAPRIARPAGLIGVAVLVVGVLLGFVFGGGAHAFLKSYLIAYCYVLSLALGGLFFVILQHLTYAGWSVVLRRIAECVSLSMPLMAVLSIPLLVSVLMGSDALFVWANADNVAADALLQHKSAYLNPSFFVIRTVFYFAAWIFLARYFYNRSVQQDTSGDPAITRRLAKVAAPGMILFALTLSGFAFDYLMSLDPHWYSTIFAVYYFSGSAVGFFALLAIIMLLIQRAGRMERVISIEHYHDIGKLIFAFVVFWAYIAYSQYMLIWYGNMPEETGWYLARQTHGWERVSLALLFGHFLVPFIGLISRFPKRSKNLLLLGAAWMLLMHWIDIYWLVMPTAHGDEVPRVMPGLLDVACLVGLGGLFIWAVASRLGGVTLLPQRDPRLHESLAFENF